MIVFAKSDLEEGPPNQRTVLGMTLPKTAPLLPDTSDLQIQLMKYSELRGDFYAVN